MQALIQRFWQSDALKGIWLAVLWATDQRWLAGIYIAYWILQFVMREVNLWRAGRMLARSPYQVP